MATFKGRTPAAVLMLSICSMLGAPSAAQTDEPPSAAITVHLDTSDTTFAADGTSVETEHVELRANNEAGVDWASRRTLSFDSLMSKIDILEAHTLKADGTVIPVAPGAIFERQMQGDGAVLSGRWEKVILFPQFEAGDSAVYTYKRTVHQVKFPGVILFGGSFDPKAQFDDMRGSIKVPNSLPVQIETHSIDYTKTAEDGFTVYHWTYSAHDLTPRDVIPVSPLMRQPRLFVSSFKDFDAAAAAYATLAAPKFAVTADIAKLADDITKGEKSRRVQAQKLYEWVARHIRYVALEFGTGSMVPHEAASVLANGYGDCKDHDALLQALLKAKGIATETVLINLGSEYNLTDVPTLTTLNHAITYIPEFKLYADSTAAVAPFGTLPFEEYGKPVLHASLKHSYRTTMPLLEPGTTAVETVSEATLSPAGSLSGTTTLKATGPSAASLRARAIAIQRTPPAQAAANELARTGYDHSAGTFRITAPKALAPSYEISATYRVDSWSDKIKGKPFSMPRPLSLFSLPGDGPMGPLFPGQLKDSEPTKCFSEHQADTLILHIPAQFHLALIPKDVAVKTDNLSFAAQWSYSANTLTLHRDFTSKVSTPVCAGKLREDTASALKEIRDHYQTQLHLVADTAAQ